MPSDSGAFDHQVGRLAPISAGVTQGMLAEVRRTDMPWAEEYREYQSEGWWTVSLYNESGDAADVEIRDCAAMPTTLLDAMPQTSAFIEGLGLKIMWARLARLTANSFLWEHVDYSNLKPVARHRLHIPLATNSSARLVIDGRSLTLSAGYIWRLAPIHPHGVCNLYGPDRIHIVIDCYENHSLGCLLAGAKIADGEATILPRLDDSTKAHELYRALCLLDLGFFSAAERHLMRLFFKYHVPRGLPYDLIVEMYQSRGSEAAAIAWNDRKSLLLATKS